MRPDLLDLATVARALDRLTTAFGKPREHEAKAAETARVYHDALRDLPVVAFDAAVRTAIQLDRFFPRPSRLRALAAERAPRSARPDAQASDQCPQCHGEFRERSYLRPPRRRGETERVAVVRIACPCGYRALLRGVPDAELEAMGLEDPDVAHELRRRARPVATSG